jgi:hypothetical protein
MALEASSPRPRVARRYPQTNMTPQARITTNAINVIPIMSNAVLRTGPPVVVA